MVAAEREEAKEQVGPDPVERHHNLPSLKLSLPFAMVEIY